MAPRARRHSGWKVSATIVHNTGWPDEPEETAEAQEGKGQPTRIGRRKYGSDDAQADADVRNDAVLAAVLALISHAAEEDDTQGGSDVRQCRQPANHADIGFQDILDNRRQPEAQYVESTANEEVYGNHFPQVNIENQFSVARLRRALIRGGSGVFSRPLRQPVHFQSSCVLLRSAISPCSDGQR